MYILGDFVSTNAAMLLFDIVRYHVEEPARRFDTPGAFLMHTPVLLEQLLFPVGMLFIYWLSGYYNRLFLKSRLQELDNTLSSCAIGAAVFFFIALINDLQPDRLHSYLLILLFFGLMFLTVYPVRRIVSRRGNRLIAEGRWRIRTIVVGEGEKAVGMIRRLGERRAVMGYEVTGVVCDGGSRDYDYGVPVYGFNDIDTLVGDDAVDAFVVVMHSGDRVPMRMIVDRLLPYGRSVLISPDNYEMLTTRIRTSNIAGEPLVDLASSNISDSTLNRKRMFDILVSSVALLVLGPAILMCGLIVKLDSPGPAFFRQVRLGRHKKPFVIYKLRTMVADAEASGPALSSVGDPRITRVGAFLRKYRIDELPQFWNILRGDMSLVGPRPEREYYVRQILERAPYYTLIQQVKPGVTSWGMVKYGYATDIEGMLERLRYELIYLDNVSIRVDIKILIYTFKTVFTGKGI